MRWHRCREEAGGEQCHFRIGETGEQASAKGRSSGEHASPGWNGRVWSEAGDKHPGAKDRQIDTPAELEGQVQPGCGGEEGVDAEESGQTPEGRTACDPQDGPQTGCTRVGQGNARGQQEVGTWHENRDEPDGGNGREDRRSVVHGVRVPRQRRSCPA